MGISDISDYAKAFICTPYIYGGNVPFLGMDCSGLVSEILKAFGILRFHEDLTAQELFLRLGKVAPVSTGEEGCILFFGVGGRVSHVAYQLSPALMIEAGGGDSSTQTIEIAAQRSAFVRIRPILSRKDLIGAILPKYECLL